MLYFPNIWYFDEILSKNVNIPYDRSFLCPEIWEVLREFQTFDIYFS